MTKTIISTSGTDIKRIRRELNLKQDVIAEIAGVSQALISQMENDHLPISIEVAQAIHTLSKGGYLWTRWFPFECSNIQSDSIETADLATVNAVQTQNNIRNTGNAFA